MDYTAIVSDFKTTSPQAHQLSLLVAFAVKVTPVLLRHMRLAFCPDCGSEVEAEVWFSPLVSNRDVEGFIFYDQVAVILRKELAKEPEFYEDVWEHVYQAHGALSAILRLEEEIYYWENKTQAVVDGEIYYRENKTQTVADGEIKRLLQSVVHAMVNENRTNLAYWAIRAVGKFNERTLQHEEIKMLSVAAKLHLDMPLDFPNTISAREAKTPNWLNWILQQKRSTKLYCTLHQGLVLISHGTAVKPDINRQDLSIPETNVLIIYLKEKGDNKFKKIELAKNSQQTIVVRTNNITIRGIDGKTFRLHQARPGIEKRILYGRDKLVKQAEQLLKSCDCLLVYGMRGNGKSVFIEALGERPTLADKTRRRIAVNSNSSAGNLYQQLAATLGDHREDPALPGNIDTEAAMKTVLQELIHPQAIHWVWLENAHLLFDGDSFKDPALRLLLLALRALLPHWQWILELREKPVRGQVRDSKELEIPGLDRASIKAFLLGSTPKGHKPWQYGGDQLKTLFQWLGGGHGQQAHALATQLLVEVAIGREMSPYETLKQCKQDTEEKIEAALLGDLFYSVLGREEQLLFVTLALYRVAVPHDHVEQLEEIMELGEARAGLVKRFVLSAGEGEQEYRLHSFIRDWLRQLQGYPLDEIDYDQLLGQSESQPSAQVLQRQQRIADCWRAEVKGRRRRTTVNITRANEALFHCQAAGPMLLSEGLDDIAADLLGGHINQIYQWADGRYQLAYRNKAPWAEQRDLLSLMIKLKPQEPKLYRFLGSCWRNEFGWEDPRASANFKRAWELSPSTPEYWANYGKTCLAQGQAAGFLAELAQYRKNGPAQPGIDDFVLAIEADCLKAVGKEDDAMALRQQQIDDGSTNPVAYNDQAQALLIQGLPDDLQQALAILELAEHRGIADDFTRSIKGRVLERLGDSGSAITLRQQQIDDGSVDPVVYADQARTLMAMGEGQQALAIVELAGQRGIANDFTYSIQGRVLQQLGRNDEAIALWQQRAEQGSNHPAIYNDLAQAWLTRGLKQGWEQGWEQGFEQADIDKANAVLALAQQNSAANDYTAAIKKKIARAQKELRG